MSDHHLDIFTNDKNWLREQPGMEPWANGCRMLQRIFDSILAENREKLFDKPVDAEHPLRHEYFLRLWACLFYHWKKQLEIEPDIAARRIVDDIKSQYKENNVFDHVALAAATVRNENKAYVVFYELFCDLFRKIATRRDMLRVSIENPAVAHEEANQDDCRESILDQLIGPPEKETTTRVRNARLESYRGHGSFKRWLYTAVDRLVSSYLSNVVSLPVLEGISVPHPNEDVTHLHEVVKTLSAEDRQLIELYYYEGWTLEEIGRSLSKPRDKSTVQRRLQVVLGQIRTRWDTVDVI